MHPSLPLDPMALVAAAPVPWCLLEHGRITACNEPLADLLQADTSRLDGRRFTTLLHPDDRARVGGLLERGGSWRADARCAPTSGAVVHVDLACAAVGPAQDGLALLVLNDVDELRSASAELRLLRDRAQELATRQRAFVATVTHELRSPLHAVMGLAELVRDADLPPEPAGLMDQLVGEVQRLSQTVDELLDISRAESGDVALELGEVDVRAVVDRVVERIGVSAPPEVTVVVSVARDVPARITSDAYRWDQILTNLVGNAVAYAGQGQVRVTIDRPERGWMRVAVADDGPGVPQEFRESIFDPFVRVPGSGTDGTGLGLPLVRSIVTALSGDITMRCPDDGGTTFTVRLPLTLPSSTRSDGDTEASRATATAAVEPSGARILVVEDTEMIQILAVRQLERLGHEALVAPTGTAALELLGTTPVDLVLMDWQLPDMDGTEVTRRFRARESRTGRRTPVIGVTANAMPETRATCLAAGMDDLLTKPLALSALERALDTWLARMRQGAGPPRVDAARLLSLATDEARPDDVLSAARTQLSRCADDVAAALVATAGHDHEGARRLLCPHVHTAAVLGFEQLAGSLRAAEASDDTTLAAALSAASHVVALTQEALGTLRTRLRQ